MKVPKDLRIRLEKAARKSGRSLTSEVGYRVERGFDYEKLFGSEYTQILIRLIASAITLIESKTGKRWHEDPSVLEMVLDAVRLIAHKADLIGTEPDKRPDDRLDALALKKAVGEPAEAIVDLVTSDQELLAETERDIFKHAVAKKESP
jgi:hypothetical protein